MSVGVMIEKPAPRSQEAEQAVLAACLIDPAALAKVVSALKVKSFYQHQHQVIFGAILRLYPNPVDFLTIRDELQRAGELEAAGGLTYLTSLADILPSTANIEAYIEIVKARELDRELIAAGTKLIEMGFDPQLEADEKVARAAGIALGVDDAVTSGPELMAHTVTRRCEEVTTIDNPIGEPTGFRDLDPILQGGLKPSRLYLIAGDPGGGKTVLLENILRRIAFRGKPVFLASLEMDRDELADRQVCSVAGIHSGRYEARRFNHQEKEAVAAAMSKLCTLQFFVDDEPTQTPMQVMAKAQKIQAEHGLAAIGIDYIQLMESGRKTENQAHELSIISRQLKVMAKKLAVPVIALSQLTREGRKREGEPGLFDLKGSGSLEQDADCVIFIYDEHPEQATNYREIIVAKQRNGPKGKARLAYRPQFYEFGNIKP